MTFVTSLQDLQSSTLSRFFIDFLFSPTFKLHFIDDFIRIISSYLNQVKYDNPSPKGGDFTSKATITTYAFPSILRSGGHIFHIIRQ